MQIGSSEDVNDLNYDYDNEQWVARVEIDEMINIDARVLIFRWDDKYRFGGDDFDDPTTNVHDVAP